MENECFSKLPMQSRPSDFCKQNTIKIFNLVENKLDDLGSVKLQFGTWNTILSKTSLMFLTETIRKEFNRFIDQVEGGIEAWSRRGSGWILARYKPFLGGTSSSRKAKIKERNQQHSKQ